MLFPILLEKITAFFRVEGVFVKNIKISFHAFFKFYAISNIFGIKNVQVECVFVKDKIYVL